MDFKVGDTVMVTSPEVVMLNCSKSFTVINIKPYKQHDIFVEIKNELDSGIINKNCLTIIK